MLEWVLLVLVVWAVVFHRQNFRHWTNPKRKVQTYDNRDPRGDDGR
jgi:hypothetical protein